jgi:aspartate-semialdehyde dehydrogenase
MLVALKPIYDAVGITRINVATYQAVSGTGKQAIEELAGQTASLLNARPLEYCSSTCGWSEPTVTSTPSRSAAARKSPIR